MSRYPTLLLSLLCVIGLVSYIIRYIDMIQSEQRHYEGNVYAGETTNNFMSMYDINSSGTYLILPILNQPHY